MCKGYGPLYYIYSTAISANSLSANAIFLERITRTNRGIPVIVYCRGQAQGKFNIFSPEMKIEAELTIESNVYFERNWSS